MQYDDIYLPPRVLSYHHSREESDTSVQFCGVKLDVPIIASPMMDICNGKMAGVLGSAGAMGIIHRFQTINEEVSEWHIADGIYGTSAPCKRIGCAIGIEGDYLDRFYALYEAGCRIFCLDTANGFNENVRNAVKNLPKQPQNGVYYVIAGNVATEEGYLYLSRSDVDAVRVGIAGGSVCETEVETGVYYPMPLSIRECARSKKHFNSSIIADGGVREPKDMIKALALGADVVMCGRIFAGYKETPGGVIKINNVKYKHYRGSASYSVQRAMTNEKPRYNEGDETIVPYVDESVVKVIERYKAGLQSAMSYHASKTLSEFREKVTVEFKTTCY